MDLIYIFFRRKQIETLGCIAEMLDNFLPLVPWIVWPKNPRSLWPAA